MANERLDSLSLANKFVLLAVMLVPPMFATAFSSFEDIKWFTMLLLAGFGGLALCIDVVRKRPITVHGGRIAILAYVFMVFALFAATYGPVPMIGLKDALTWSAGSFLFLLGLSSSGRGIGFAELAIAIAIATFGVAASGLLELAGIGLTTVVWDPIGPTGAFDSRELLAPFYAGALPILSAAVIRVTRGKVIVGVGLLVGAVHFGLTMLPALGVGIAATVIVVSLLVVILQKPARAVLLYPVFGVVVVVGVIVATLGMFGQGEEAFSDANRLPLAAYESPRIEQLADGRPRSANFAIGRVEEVSDETAWKYVTGIGLDLLRDSPVGGQGAGSWWVMQTRFPRGDDPFVVRMFDQYPAFQSAHNSIVQMGAELGVVGLLLFLAWISAVFGVTITAFANREEPENWVIEHWGLTASAAAFLVLSVQAPALNFAGSAVVFFPVLALLVREGAVLNGFKGLSSPLQLGGGSNSLARLLFAGIVPSIIAISMITMAFVVTVSNYHRGLADHLMLRTQFKDAATEYKKADAVFPYRGEILYNEALTWRRIGTIAEAKDLIERAVKLRPHDARIVFLTAILASNDKQTTEAIRSAKHAIALFPNYIDAHKQLAIAYDMAGRITEAANVLKATLDLDPPERLKAPMYAQMAHYYEDALGQPKAAAEAFRNAARLTKDKIDRDQFEFRAKELEKQIERDRLMREGKKIPKELMPAEPKGDQHGLPQNLQPNVPERFMKGAP